MNIPIQEPFFIIFHTTYADICIGLYQGAHALETATIDKKNSSKSLLPTLDMLLSKHNRTLQHCAFIGAHIGPGPFTTVRVSIASVNGLAFATQLPLVGVNGLDALLNEHQNIPATLVAILDAYCDDLYYAIQSGTTREMGVAPFETICNNPLIRDAIQTTWIGNGVLLNKEKIETLRNAQILEPLPEICSIDTIAQNALIAWQNKQHMVNQLLPLYMKSGSAIMGKRIT